VTEAELRILVVDDDPDHRELVRDALECHYGTAHVVEANDAQRAMVLLQEDVFDAVILDYLLPGLTGLEALPQIRAAHPDIVVIVTTARGDEEIAAASLKTGAADYVVKSVALADRLPKALDAALEAHRLRAEAKRAEKRIAHLNSVLRAIRNVNQLITHEKDRDRLLQEACRLLAETRGYYSSWIVRFDRDGNVADSFTAEDADRFSKRIASLPRGEFPHCIAATLEQPGKVVVEQAGEACEMCLRPEAEIGAGTLSIALAHAGRVHGVLLVSLPVEMSTNPEEHSLFTEVAEDIAFALHAIEADSERRRTQIALDEQSRRVNALFEHSLTPLVLLDRSFNFLRVNRAYADACERAPSDFIGRNHFDLYPSDAQLLFEQAITTRRPVTARSYPLVFGDQLDRDTTYWDWTIAPVLDDAAEVEFLVFSLNDVTSLANAQHELQRHKDHLESLVEQRTTQLRAANERLESEIREKARAEAALHESAARLRSVIENMPVMVTAYGDDRVTRVLWNKECERVTGYRKDEIVGNLGADEMLYPDPEYRQRMLSEWAVRGGNYRDWEWRTTCTDGAVRTIAWSSISEQAPVPGWSLWGIGIDVTDRKRAEDAQRLAAVGQLAAGVAHEFNNLMAVMMLQGELAGESNTAEQYNALVEIVSMATVRGREICRDLTTFARPGEPKREPVQIETILENAMALTAHHIENAGIQVARDFNTTGQRVHADRQQLEQVFLNLLMNACHAMPAGGALTIKARYAPNGSDPGRIVVTVADTGTGISPDHLPHIFEPFFTTKGVLGESDTPGTGLGLSVSMGIVQAHGGAISVWSDIGRGTAFEVALPISHVSAQSLDARDRTHEATHQLCVDSPARILVAEDMKGLSNLITAILTAGGHDVVQVAATGEALEALNADRFDLVITDLLMPGGGGNDVIAFTKELDEPPPVLVVTGVTAPGIEEQVVALGAVECVRKPFKRTDLIQAVARVLSRRSA